MQDLGGGCAREEWEQGSREWPGAGGGGPAATAARRECAEGRTTRSDLFGEWVAGLTHCRPSVVPSSGGIWVGSPFLHVGLGGAATQQQQPEHAALVRARACMHATSTIAVSV